MDYLKHFFTHGTLIELGLVSIAGIVAVVLVVVGIWIGFSAKSRLMTGVYAGFAFVPLLLCLFGILAQWLHNRALYLTMENPATHISSDRADYLIAGVIGICLTAIPALIGTFALLKPKPR